MKKPAGSFPQALRTAVATATAKSFLLNGYTTLSPRGANVLCGKNALCGTMRIMPGSNPQGLATVSSSGQTRSGCGCKIHSLDRPPRWGQGSAWHQGEWLSLPAHARAQFSPLHRSRSKQEVLWHGRWIFHRSCRDSGSSCLFYVAKGPTEGSPFAH